MLLVAIACMGIAGWKSYGRSTVDRTAAASGQVGALGDSLGGGAGGGGGGGAVARPGRTNLEDVNADATPPPAEDDSLFSNPVILVAAAAVLLLALLARKFATRGNGTAESTKEA